MRNLLVVPILLFVASAQPRPALDPTIQQRLDAFLRTWKGHWTIGYSDDGREIRTITGRPDASPERLESEYPALLRSVALMRGTPEPEFSAPIHRSLGDATQTIYHQVLDDQRVDGATVTFSRSAKGDLYDIVLSQVPASAPPRAVRSLESAGWVALKRYCDDVQQEAKASHRTPIVDCAMTGKGSPLISAEPVVKAGRPRDATSPIAVDGRIRRVHQLVVSALLPSGHGQTLIDARQYSIDATTTAVGPTAVLRVLKMLSFLDGKANVFDPNPMRAKNAWLLDGNPVSCDAYAPRPLRDLNPAQNGQVVLDGPFVAVREMDSPTFCPACSPLQNAESRWPNVRMTEEAPDFRCFGEGSPEFAGAMAYYHVDAMQRYVQQLGYVISKVVVDAASGDNANVALGKYLDCCPDCGCVAGYVSYIGLGRKGRKFVAEDGTVIAHEYGHKALANGTDGRFLASSLNPEAGAINEGFADYWALTSFYDQSKDTGFVDCYGEWANGRRCERKYTDRPSFSNFDPAADEHSNGGVWSNALFDIFKILEKNRRVSDAIILQGHYLRAHNGSAPTMQRIAEGIVIAARMRPDDRSQAVCEVFKQHGILPTNCP
jgi:hypothetical protein